MAVKEVEANKNHDEERQLDDNLKLLKNLRFQHIIDINMVRVFIAVWLVAAVVAVLPFMRPDYSEVEKRELQDFPKFSFKALVTGDYFDEINLWFSDTFPMRDKFVALNTAVTDCFGVNTVQVHGDVHKGDEIPVIQPEVQPPVTESVDSSSEPEPQLPAVEQLGAMLIVNDAAFEYYNFNQQTANSYSAAVSRAADMLNGRSWVYNIIAPTSMDITMADKMRVNTNSSDQKAAIDYMYSIMSPNVYEVDVFTSLKKHRDEYVYFRTDHHWTALGAYYAYREFAAVKGVTPVELSTFTEYKFDGFLGSFYAESGQKPQLSASPDYIMAYEPTQVQYIHTWLETGGEKDYHIVSNADDLSESNKYLTFICGDHPLGLITNPEITDNSSCLVIKESYGNAMISYLTQHYQNVWVVDYRYISKVYSGTLSQFVDEKGIGEVVFINNISATRNASLVSALDAFIG